MSAEQTASTAASPTPSPTPDDVGRIGAEILDEVERAIVGKRSSLLLTLSGLLANGHVLLEDLPGLAKTLLARSFATAMGLDMARVQFTPDLLPGDITGSSILDAGSRQLVFQPGPLFANLVLGDEINRAPPKTQAALLEAMQERQVTVDGTTHRLPDPFLVLATQNPIEYEGTYPLPEAQLDRFMLRVSMGYPAHDDEVEVLRRRIDRGTDEPDLQQVIDAGTVVELQRAVEGVHAAPALLGYVVDLVTATRQHPNLAVGASPRGSLAVIGAARALAALDGRDFATPDDVKWVAPGALSHRVVLRPELWVQGTPATDVIADCLDNVATPHPTTLQATD